MPLFLLQIQIPWLMFPLLTEYKYDLGYYLVSQLFAFVVDWLELCRDICSSDLTLEMHADIYICWQHFYMLHLQREQPFYLSATLVV